MQTQQNKCLRTVYGRRAWPGTNEAHIQNGLLLAKERQILHLLKYAHRIDRKNLRPHRERTLRSNRKVLQLENRVKHTRYGKSFVHLAIKIWNNLSEELKRIRDINSFSTRIKAELKQNKIRLP